MHEATHLRRDRTEAGYPVPSDKCEPAVRKIPEAIAALENALARVEKIAQELERRLNAICTPSPPSTTGNGKNAALSSVPLAGEINRLEAVVHCIVDCLESIDNRLEI